MGESKVVPTVKVVISLLGLATFVGATVIMPGTPVIVAPIFRFIGKELEKRDEIKNHKFDKVRLWVLLRRLEKQKEVTWETLPDGSAAIKLTEKGKVKHLKYKLEEIGEKFTGKNWDGKWRIIIFDVPEKKRASRDTFRNFLKNLKFYPLQKSVYLTPYPCEDEVNYLRYYFDLGDNVQLLVVNNMENDTAYRLYFGLT